MALRRLYQPRKQIRNSTLSIVKAEGSGSGSVAITYVLTGQANVSNGRGRFKSKVYKARVKVEYNI